MRHPIFSARSTREIAPRSMRSGFTIIELLTVMGIVALVVGILAPALSSARAGGRRVKCQLNLKQMAGAAQAYAAMFDAYPAAVRYDNADGVFRTIAWDWVTTFNHQVLSPGPLWGYLNNPGEVQQCPDFDGSSGASGDPYTGYNYNTTYVGGEVSFPHVGWTTMRKGVPPHACSRAATCAMFGDGGWKGGANKFMRAPLNTEHAGLSTVFAGGQAFRHRGCTNIAFVDGHVGSTRVPCRGALASDALLNQYMAFPRNGFLSDDDSLYDPR